MDIFQEKLEKVIEKTFTILRDNHSESRIVFPTYRDSQRRVSEQELRFVFVEQVQNLLKEYDYYYSVETPTNSKYVFSENKKYAIPYVATTPGYGRSASFDLSIEDRNGNTIAIIEFKAKSADAHEYAKDLCKLWNPYERSHYKYFLNLFEKIGSDTKNRFMEKLDPKTNPWLNKKESNENVILIAQSLRAQDKPIKMAI